MDFNYQGYELKFIQRKKIKDDSDHLFSYIYKFYSPVTKLNYVVIADYHKNDFFAIKFYPKQFRKTDHKYSLIVDRGDVGNIIITCINVIPELLKHRPLASFGFAASRTYDKKSKRIEPLASNQRFTLYRYVAERKIGNATFQHFAYPDISGYMLINRSVDVKQTEAAIRLMLYETYNDLPML